MVLDRIDQEGLAWYYPDDVYKELSYSVLTIGLPVIIPDDEIGEVNGFEYAPEKFPDKDL